FNLEPDLVEQLAADQMPVRVVDLLEMVEVDEDDAELVIETMRTIDLRFERLVQMSCIVKAGAIVRNREFLDLFDGACVLDGDSRVVAERMQEEHLIVGEALHGAVDELDHAEYPMLRLERHADDRARLPLGHLVDAL